MSEPSRNRTQAFLLNLATGQGLTLLTTIVAFVATPVIVRHLGVERYGLWRVLEVWVAYVGLIPQCVVQAAGFLLVPLLAQRNPEQLRRFAATLAVVGGAVAVVVSCAGLALVPALPWIASGPEDLDGERRTAFVIALLAGVPLAPLLLLRCVLEADQKGYLLNAVLAVQSLTVTGLAVWLSLGNNGLPGQAVAVAAGAALQGLLLAILVYRRYPWSRPGWPVRAEAAALLHRTSGLLLLAVLGGIAARIEYPLVNSFHGPEATAHYTLGQRLFLVYASLVAAIGNSIWAPAADLYHRGESERLCVQLGRAVRGTVVAGAAGAVAIAGVTPVFLRLWIGDGYDPGPLARSGFAATFPLLGLNILLTWVLAATGHTRLMLVSTALYCVVTAGAGVWLGSIAGPGGVAWGMVLGLGTTVAVNLAFSSTVFGISAISLAARLALTAVLAGVYGFGFAEIVRLVPDMGWIRLLGTLGTGWVGFLMLGWFLILKPEDRRELRTRFLQR